MKTKSITTSIRLTEDMLIKIREIYGGPQHVFELALVLLELIPLSEFKGTIKDFEIINKRGKDEKATSIIK